MSDSESDKPNLRPEEVLLELFNLLEQYAPMWYAEEQHDRALAALRSSPKPGSSGTQQLSPRR
jgi:hypothetical protein